jgi:prolyl-tRNA synthetase
MMGGRESWDYLAPTTSGENELVLCENGDYAADREAARGVPRAPDFPASLPAPEEVETPNVTTIDELATLLGIDAAATSKAMPVVTANGQLVLGLVRGDDQLNEEKLMTVLESGFRPATDEEIRSAFGAGGGSLGPVDVDVEIVADELLREGQFVAGANRDGWHLRGVQAGRDYEPRFADIRQMQEGDRCPNCGGALSIQTAIEVGHIFKLGTYYSVPFHAMFLDEDGQEKPLVMGSYGVGPARTIAAIVEQHHDEHGIAWPSSVAPYDAHVVALPGLEQQAEEAAAALDAAGNDVILDDRDQRAGEKFADADLIGCPIRVTVGKKTLDDGAVDVRDRTTGDEERVPIPELSGKLASV